jgi:hypothetical protein
VDAERAEAKVDIAAAVAEAVASAALVRLREPPAVAIGSP